MGEYFYDKKEWAEAAIWYYNAAYETTCQMSLKAGTTQPLEKLVLCYEKLEMPETAEEYKKQLANVETELKTQIEDAKLSIKENEEEKKINGEMGLIH